MTTDDGAWLGAALHSGHAADEACRAALAEGGVITIWADSVRVKDLAVIYRRRIRHVLARGTELVGSDAVDRLTSSGRTFVRLGQVSQPDWHFQLFLALDGDEVVSCLGVQQEPPV